MENKTNGYLPVNILDCKVLKLFNILIESESQELFKKGLKRYLKLFYTDEPITDIAEIVPKSNPETLEKECQISLYDNFCQFFWCLCYSAVVSHEVFFGAANRKASNPDQDGEIDSYKKKAYEVFMAGVSLFNPEERKRVGRSDFFSLPMPDCTDDHYVVFVNNVYIAGINFILLHELKHFELCHLEKNKEDKQDETDADLGAYWHLILSEITDDQKRFFSLGALLALCSLTFLDDTMKGDESHPDPEKRIASILNCNEILEKDREYYYAIICICFKFWFFHYKDKKDFPQIEDAESWQIYWDKIAKYIEDKKRE